MKRIILNSFLGVTALFIIACGNNGEAQNENVNLNAQVNSAENVNAENANINAADSGEVPTFTDADEAFAAGEKYFDANENQKAIDAYRQATKLNPDLADAHFQLGVAYALEEALEKEQETPTPETDTTPTPKKKKNAKPELTKSEKSFENAVTAYKNIIKKDKDNALAFFNMGRSYKKLGDDKEARKALEQAAKLEPENSLYQTELGAILIDFAKYDDAVRALKKAVKLDETNLTAQELLEAAEAGKKRVDFGANKIVEGKRKGQEQ